MKKNNSNVTSTTKVSFEEICKPVSVSKTINRMPALEAEFKKVFGYNFTPSVLSDIIAECDKNKVKKLFNQKKNYVNDYFLNPTLTSATARANTKSQSTRLLRSEWEFIDSIITNDDDDKTVLRGKSNFIFFLAFLVYCKKENISINKTIREDFNQPIFDVMGNKKWFKDNFYGISKQLLEEKDIETTLDLFGGSGVLTGYIQDYCYKNNLDIESSYNDFDENKLNFFEQLTKSPQQLERKCRKLLETYDYYKNNGTAENILKLKKDVENLINQKGLHGAAAFWFISITNKNGNITQQKRKSLEQFAYASKLYKKVAFKRSDALYRLEKWYDNEKAFIVVDPPYPFTRGYKNKRANKDFSLKSHKKLCQKLVNAKATWVYFGRIKAPRSYVKNQSEKELAIKDAQHLAFFDDNFQNKGLFYLDVPINDTVERIVSNYPFEGFKPYVEEAVSPSVEVKEAEETVPSPVETEETEVTVSSPVETEEVATVENTVHTESSSTEEAKTDNHESVIKEKTKKKRKECCIVKFFRKLLRCRE